MEEDLFAAFDEDTDIGRYLEPEAPPVHGARRTRPASVLRYETENARYVHGFGVHSDELTPPEDVYGADAIMLESGSFEYADLDMDTVYDMEPYGAPHYRSIIEANLDGERAPIFYTDLPTASDDERMRYMPLVDAKLRQAAPFLGGIAAATGGEPGLAIPMLGASLVSLGGQYLAQEGGAGLAPFLQLPGNSFTTTGLRSAVMAQKVDEVIAPSLEGGGKPLIYIQTGSAHLDMPLYMRHTRFRDAVLRAHGVTGDGFCDPAYRDRIGVLRTGEGEAVFHDARTGEDIPYTLDVRTVSRPDGLDGGRDGQPS